jgi:probable HAF family extracellular repeat protein
MRRRILALAVVWAFLWPAWAQAEIEYEVIDLGTLGSDHSVANFINSNGQIVGWASTSHDFGHATIFDAIGSGNNIDLGTLGGDRSTAHSINSTGQIVGWAHNNQVHQRATIFDSTGAGNNIDLGTLGGDESRALSINDAGQIVGEATNKQGRWHATLFDPTGDGNNIDIGALGSYESWANSINSVGRIVGTEAHKSEEWADYHATPFDPTAAGNNIYLGTLGGDWSMAYSINDANQIVGAAQNNFGFWRATLFDPTGNANNIELGTLGGDESRAYSINNKGQIVGGASERATLFDRSGAGKNIDLNNLIDPNCGWILIQALCISDTGWIVGEGWNPESELHGFLLAPQSHKYSGGTGEPNDPYQIATAEDLILLGESPEDYDKHFIMTADIDLDPNLPGRKVFDRAVIAPDTNDVTSWFDGNAFTGVFDGNDHTISHLTITGGEYLGLFGQLDPGAKVSNLGLEAVIVHGTVDCVGGLVGYNNGRINTSYSTGTISGQYGVGALVGYNSGSIVVSYSTAMANGRFDIGGLVGNNNGSIAASYSTGTVSGESRVGGLIGSNNTEGIITTSYSIGTISGQLRTGGLVGDNDGSIASSYSTGIVTGIWLVGGLVGQNYGNVDMSFWDKETSGQLSSAGGIGLTTAKMRDIDTFLSEGWDFVNEVINGTCDYWQISPGEYPLLRYHFVDDPLMPEGLGTTQEPYLIRDASDLGTVWSEPLANYRLEAYVDLSGITWAVAVVPWFGGTFDGNGNVITNLHIEGGGYLGLFGQLASGAKVSNLGMEVVDINGTGHYIGGLVGYNWNGTITTSYSTGTIIGNEDVGGLVGYNSYNSSITGSYSKSTMSGNNNVGGLVGYNWGSIITSYSTGTVSGNEDVGGLVGYGHLGGRAGHYESTTTSFWDMEASGQSTSAGGTGKTTAEMQTVSTFLEAGWDFIDETENGVDDIWWILEGQDYPRLWWEAK